MGWISEVLGWSCVVMGWLMGGFGLACGWSDGLELRGYELELGWLKLCLVYVLRLVWISWCCSGGMISCCRCFAWCMYLVRYDRLRTNPAAGAFSVINNKKNDIYDAFLFMNACIYQKKVVPL